MACCHKNVRMNYQQSVTERSLWNAVREWCGCAREWCCQEGCGVWNRCLRIRYDRRRLLQEWYVCCCREKLLLRQVDRHHCVRRRCIRRRYVRHRCGLHHYVRHRCGLHRCDHLFRRRRSLCCHVRSRHGRIRHACLCRYVRDDRSCVRDTSCVLRSCANYVHHDTPYRSGGVRNRDSRGRDSVHRCRSANNQLPNRVGDRSSWLPRKRCIASQAGCSSNRDCAVSSKRRRGRPECLCSSDSRDSPRMLPHTVPR